MEVRPLIHCGQDGSNCSACAWATTVNDTSGPPAKPPCLGQVGNGLCGWVRKVGNDTAEELDTKLKAIGLSADLKYQNDAPLLKLEDPQIWQSSLWWSAIRFLVLAFLALPCGYVASACWRVDHRGNEQTQWLDKRIFDPDLQSARE